MAAVHPSRAHLVPSSSSRDTSNNDYREDKRYRPRHGEDEGRQRSSRREDHQDDGDRRDNDRQNSRRDYDDKNRGRSRSRSRSRDRRDESHTDRDRRASPSYDEYRRPATPPLRPNMYGPRAGRLPDPSNGHGWGGGIGGGGDWMEHRRKQREASTLSIWPPSPKAPARDDSPSRHHKSSKKTKRSRSNDSDVSTDSEADRRSRKDKKSSKHRSSRHRSHKFSSSKKSHRRHSSDDDDSASEADDFDKRQHYKKGKEREKDTQDRESRSRSEAHSNESMERDVGKLDVRDDEEGYWVEAQTAPGSDGAVAPRTEAEAIALVSGAQMDLDDDGDDDEIGPVPLRQADGKVDERAYGGALLRGEGSAMAAFVQDGQRIPRRGEIGLTSDQIDAYEKVGYVMSGSRHRRMNAVRMRKENQVISAEEKRGILKMQKEEKMKREALIVGGFKEIVEERLKGTGQK